MKRVFCTLALVAMACSSSKSSDRTAVVEGTCVIPAGDTSTQYLERIDCTPDFQALASEPIDSTLPGARSTKVVLDQAESDKVFFQNSVMYKIHYEFVSTHLSGNGLPIVQSLAQFNTTEYYTPDRRFVLGAVTYYDGPKVWAVELSPYDTASAAMIEKLYRQVKAATFFGPALYFHPTSEAVAAEAKKLPADIPIKTTDELYAGIDYQPLTLATGVGHLVFTKAADLDSHYVSYQDIVVLDEVPNDISVVQGIISQEFQTPLSHVNVLSANRHTPNMGLRNALANPQLLALKDKLVELTVGSSTWSVREVSQAEAEAYWAAHKPAPVTLPTLDLGVTAITDIENVTPEPATSSGLRDAIKKAVLAYGGKAAHYSILTRTNDVPIQKAFAIPVFYYDQFMKQNGFYTTIDGYLADATFNSDLKTRDAKLAELRTAMIAAPVDATFQSLLKTKMAEAEYANHKIRFRTSTNSEDLDGFPCAGCYDSNTGDPASFDDVLTAIKTTWSTIWKFRTFEERSYYSIDHKTVGMALLVHRNFPDEEANGVAVTANPFDDSGLDPAFFVNVQAGGDAEVVAPPAGVTSDQFLYYFNEPNQPTTYLTHSNLIPSGTSVLTSTQVHSLGVALKAIHDRFSPAYGPASGNTGFYAMDCEFKFDNDAAPTQPAKLYIKQARPYPGRGSE